MEPIVHYIPARNIRLDHNVAIYCRVSTSSREQLDSLSEQVSALTRMVASVDQWRLVDVFIDIASAKGEAPRKQFERMLQMGESNQLSVIITKSVSRFGRDTVETLDALRRLKAAGVRVIFEEESLDTNEDSETILAGLSAYAQSENESRSENIRWGLSKRAAQGTSKVFKRIAYGYKHDEKGNLVIDEEQAKVVRDIFRWYLDGMSTVGIINKLYEAKIPTQRGKEKWSKDTIDKILRNEKYIGVVVTADPANEGQMFKMTEANPPIITESEFKTVQEARKKRSNVEYDADGTVRRKSTKYSSKKKS